jgi:hypothetical protein
LKNKRRWWQWVTKLLSPSVVEDYMIFLYKKMPKNETYIKNCWSLEKGWWWWRRGDDGKKGVMVAP